MISHGMSSPPWQGCVATLDASGRWVAILDCPKGKSEVTAQEELRDKLYETCIFKVAQWRGGCPAALTVELIKHVHLINVDVLEGIWPPEERSHEFHNEA